MSLALVLAYAAARGLPSLLPGQWRLALPFSDDDLQLGMFSAVGLLLLLVLWLRRWWLRVGDSRSWEAFRAEFAAVSAARARHRADHAEDR